MAARFWVGGTGTWDASDTTHWSATSGGAGGQTVPGVADNVTFDGSSGGGTVTVNTSFSILTLSWGTYTGTIDFSVNNNSPTLLTFNGSGTSTRAMSLGSGTFTITGNNSANLWQMATTTGLTWSAGTSTINFTYSGSTGTRTVSTGTAALNNVNFSAGTDAVTLTTTFLANSLNFTGYSGNLSNTVISLTGSLTFGTGMTATSGASTLSFLGTSGTQVFTSSGVQFNRPITINAPGGGVQLADALNTTGASARTFTHTAGSFDTNGKTWTVDIYVSSNSNVRTLTLGASTVNVIGSGTTIWSTSTSTNMTLNFGTSTINFTYSGSTGTRSIGLGSTLTYNNINVSAGSDTVSVTGNGTIANSFSFAGFTGTNSAMATISLTGNLTLGTGMTCTSVSNVLTFSATSGTQTLTSNGVQMNRPVTINAPGATVRLADAFNNDGASVRQVTLSAGTLDDNGKSFTIGSFGASGSTTRAVIIGTGWNIVGSGTTVWSTSTPTNLTITQTGPVIFSYSGSVGTRTITPGASTEANSISFAITAGSDTVTFSGTSRAWKDADFTGFTGIWTTGGPETTYGNLTISASMTVSMGGTLTFGATSGIKTITSNGNVMATASIAVNGVGGALSLADALSISGTLTLTNGTFTDNNKNVTANFFASSNSNVRTLTLGSGTWTLTGSGTVWNTSTNTNLTFNAGTSTIVMNDASSSSKTFADGGLTFNNLTISGSGTGTFVMGSGVGTMTFNVFTVSNPPHTVQFFAGSTTVVSSIIWSGTAGNINTFQSTVNGTPWFINDTSGTNREDYISLQDSWASGGANFSAGVHSVNAGDNRGWVFINELTSVNASRDQNHITGKLAVLYTDGTTVLPIKINASNNGIEVDMTSTIGYVPTPIDRQDANFVDCWLFTGPDGLTYPANVNEFGQLLISTS